MSLKGSNKEGAKVESQTTIMDSAISKSPREATVQELEKERLTPEEMFSLASHRSMDPFDMKLDLPPDDHKRLRFWEIETFFKCPVAGWCIDLGEQREIIRKYGYSTKGASDLEVHEILVESLEKENPLSRRIDLWLNRKYQKEINELSSLETEAFIKHWEASVDKEGFDGIVWVAVTRADLSAEVRRSMFGDVHMQTHVRARQLDKERQKFHQEQRKRERLEKNAKEISRKNKILRRENKGLKDQLAAASRLSDDLMKNNRKLEEEISKVNEDSLIVSLREESARLKVEKDEALKQVSTYQRELRRLENQNSKLLSRLKKQEQICFQGVSESGDSIMQTSDSSAHNSSSSIDLSKRCILVVGGLPKMEALFRQLIEKNNGSFLYHDGRMNKGIGSKELVRQVRRADLVICCIDHSSHTSALIVKTVCKKYKKPFRMLINSSLNNVSSTLLAFQKA